ncbi:hypothetical protein G6F65_017427 [Rhizopus arrhizus]|nr:hypothetical protein G6F65_017427 [Rhizopus arrhizus]
MHDIARVHQPRAHPARDRRHDARVVQLHPGIADLRVIGLRRGLQLRPQRALRVQRLLRGGVLALQTGVALQVQAGVQQRRLVLRPLRLRLRQLGLQGARVDIGQHLPGLHVLPFDETHAVQLPVHARLDRHAGRRRHRAHARQITRHVLLAHGRRRHRHHRLRRGGRRGAAPQEQPDRQHTGHDGKRHEACAQSCASIGGSHRLVHGLTRSR